MPGEGIDMRFQRMKLQKSSLGYRVWGLVKTKKNSKLNAHLPPASQGPSSRKEF